MIDLRIFYLFFDVSTWAQAVAVLSAYFAYKALGLIPSTEEKLNLWENQISFKLESYILFK